MHPRSLLTVDSEIDYKLAEQDPPVIHDQHKKYPSVNSATAAS